MPQANVVFSLLFHNRSRRWVMPLTFVVGVVFRLLINAEADGPRISSPLETSARVVAVEGNSATLATIHPGRPLLPGMVLTIVSEERPVAVAEIVSVSLGEAQAIVSQQSEQVAVTPGMTAVGPCPIPVTATDGKTASVALPFGHNLAHGTRLRVVREGVERGSAALILDEGQPPGAVVIGDPAFMLKPGDICYAVAELVNVPPPASVVAAPPPIPVSSAIDKNGSGEAIITSVSGNEVFLWSPSPGALAAVDRLTITREGKVIGIVQLQTKEPLKGTLETLSPEVAVVAGDHVRPWVEGDSPPPPPAAPQESDSPFTVVVATPAKAESATLMQEVRSEAERPSVSPPSAEPAPSRPGPPELTPPRGLSLSGPTGILRTPNADVQPLGVVRMGRGHISADLDRSFPGSRGRSQFTLGAVERVEVGVAHYPRFQEDLTYHAKVQLWPESRKWPTLAIGTMDERASYGLSATRFLTLGKHFFDGRLRATLGYGEGGLTGVFGGLEAAITPHFALLAEYDTKQINLGLRAMPHSRLHLD
ncbi:MAG: YjbH domain-containing protein, partial [Candidatus Zipacnadales bacterium]